MMGRFGRACLKSLVLCLAAAPFLSLPQRADAETWRVEGLGPNARLHIREEASADGDVIGYVPGDARGLVSRACVGNWCEITYDGVRGWVYKSYLAPDNAAAPSQAAAPAAMPDADRLNLLANTKRLGVVATDRPIPIYAFPDDKLPVAGILPSATREVLGLGSCMRSWCYVRSGGLIGWMHVSLFDLEATAAPEVTAAIEPEPPKDEPPPVASPLVAPPAEEQNALNTTETTASNVTIATQAATLPKVVRGGQDTKFYSLAGLGGASALPVFGEPDGNGPVLAHIPRDATNVEGLKKCQDRWCLVRWEEATGWVARRHLADQSAAEGQSFQVTGLPLWTPLKVLDHPADDAREVGSIPSYATGVVPIGLCNQYWCHVRYLGVAGWVAARNLQPQTR